jgi:NAD(P)H dehydrogenase (quinone)
MNGTWRDKMHTLTSLSVFAAQHHMHWVNLGLGAGWNSSSVSEDDLNRLGFWLGAGAQTDVDAHSDQMHPSDVRTCNHLGRRVAVVTRQLNLGRAASSPAASSAPIH